MVRDGQLFGSVEALAFEGWVTPDEVALAHRLAHGDLAVGIDPAELAQLVDALRTLRQLVADERQRPAVSQSA
jgi:hypothetical protein